MEYDAMLIVDSLLVLQMSVFPRGWG